MAISVGEAVREAFSITTAYFRTLVQVVAIPYALTVGIRLVGFLATHDAVERVQQTNDPRMLIEVGLASFPFALAAYLAGIPFATAWYRYCVAKGQVGWGQLGFRFGAREFAYLGYSLLFAVILVGILIPAAILTAVSPPLGVIAIIGTIVLTIYLLARWVLVLPGAAVGAGIGLGDSWNRTREEKWRVVWVFMVMLLIIIGLSIAVGLVSAVIGLAFGVSQTEAPGLPAFLIQTLIAEAVSFYGAALIVTALAYIFRELSGFDPGKLSGSRSQSGQD